MMYETKLFNLIAEMEEVAAECGELPAMTAFESSNPWSPVYLVDTIHYLLGHEMLPKTGEVAALASKFQDALSSVGSHRKARSLAREIFICHMEPIFPEFIKMWNDIQQLPQRMNKTAAVTAARQKIDNLQQQMDEVLIVPPKPHKITTPAIETVRQEFAKLDALGVLETASFDGCVLIISYLVRSNFVYIVFKHKTNVAHRWQPTALWKKA